ncbi:MAG: helix-turn-helix domain-containing protein [Thiogranum sp.]
MTAADVRKLLGVRIRDLRESRRYSQDVLAELSGLNRSYIGSLERGEHNCGITNIVRVAKALDVPLYKLFNKVPAGSQQRYLEPAGDSDSARPLVNRKQFLQLLKQCAHDRPDLVAIYLERCGVAFHE